MSVSIPYKDIKELLTLPSSKAIENQISYKYLNEELLLPRQGDILEYISIEVEKGILPLELKLTTKGLTRQTYEANLQEGVNIFRLNVPLACMNYCSLSLEICSRNLSYGTPVNILVNLHFILLDFQVRNKISIENENKVICKEDSCFCPYVVEDGSLFSVGLHSKEGMKLNPRHPYSRLFGYH